MTNLKDLNKLIEVLNILSSIKGENEESMRKGEAYSALIGKKCIVRTYYDGVVFGEVEEAQPQYVRIKNARKLWRWQAKQGIALESVAKYGLDHSKSRITASVSVKEIYESYSIISMTEEAIQSLETAPESEQS